MYSMRLLTEWSPNGECPYARPDYYFLMFVIIMYRKIIIIKKIITIISIIIITIISIYNNYSIVNEESVCKLIFCISLMRIALLLFKSSILSLARSKSISKLFLSLLISSTTDCREFLSVWTFIIKSLLWSFVLVCSKVKALI